MPFNLIFNSQQVRVGAGTIQIANYQAGQSFYAWQALTFNINITFQNTAYLFTSNANLPVQQGGISVTNYNQQQAPELIGIPGANNNAPQAARLDAPYIPNQNTKVLQVLWFPANQINQWTLYDRFPNGQLGLPLIQGGLIIHN